MTQGFYKLQEENLLYAPNIIEGDGYLLLAQDKDQYEYPIDGWYWFTNEEEAREVLSKI
jgi:hypothetical protein